MDNTGSARGVWTGLVVTTAIAVVFIILWILRGGELEAAQGRSNSARAEATAAIGTLESDLRIARTGSERISRQIGELTERLEEERRRTAEAVRDGEAKARAAMKAVEDRYRESARRLEKALSDVSALTVEVETLRSDLAEAGKRESGLVADIAAVRREGEAERARFLAASRERGEAAALREEKARLESERDEARAAQADAEKALLEAEKEKERLGVALAREVRESGATGAEQARDEIAALRAAAQEDGRKIAELTRTVEGLRSRADREREQAARREKEITALRRELAAAETAATEHETLAEKHGQALREEFAIERKALHDRIATLHRQVDDLRTVSKEARNNRNATAAGSASSASRPVESTGEEQAAEVTGFSFVGDPDRFLGGIAEILEDGRTFTVAGGWKRHMHPGLRLDVHRRDGAGYRFVGMARVVRSWEEFSVVEMLPPVSVTGLCPVTGRAVLEPGAAFSPYAVDRMGRGIPLKPAADGLEGEAPRVGDLVDNPLFSADERRRFAVDHDMAVNPDVLRLIALLNGVPCLGDGMSAADYTVTPMPEPGADRLAKPRSIPLGYLEAYAERVVPAKGRKGR